MPSAPDSTYWPEASGVALTKPVKVIDSGVFEGGGEGCCAPSVAVSSAAATDAISVFDIDGLLLGTSAVSISNDCILRAEFIALLFRPATDAFLRRNDGSTFPPVGGVPLGCPGCSG